MYVKKITVTYVARSVLDEGNYLTNEVICR